MRVISQNELTKALFHHPYDTAPNYRAAMSVVHLSSDDKLLVGYWHAPAGEVELAYGENREYNYVIRGEIQVVREDGTSLIAREGEIIECGGAEETVLFRIRQYAVTLFIVYPQSGRDASFVRRLQARNEPPHFIPQTE